MSQLTVNEKHRFNIVQKDEKTFIDSKEFVFDLKQIKDNIFHILHENKSYTAELVSINQQEKKAKVKINGNEYDVSLQDKYAELLETMGMNHSTKNSIPALKAPMPGMVLDILIKVGDQVNKGDSLLILEAMKMENIIKSSTTEIIKSIEIEKGSTVEKDQLLLTFE
jgi:biotin carboxyl carrier protein